MSDGVTDYWRSQGGAAMTTSDSVRPLTAAAQNFALFLESIGVDHADAEHDLRIIEDEARAGSLDAATLRERLAWTAQSYHQSQEQTNSHPRLDFTRCPDEACQKNAAALRETKP